MKEKRIVKNELEKKLLEVEEHASVWRRIKLLEEGAADGKIERELISAKNLPSLVKIAMDENESINARRIAIDKISRIEDVRVRGILLDLLSYGNLEIKYAAKLGLATAKDITTISKFLEEREDIILANALFKSCREGCEHGGELIKIVENPKYSAIAAFNFAGSDNEKIRETLIGILKNKERNTMERARVAVASLQGMGLTKMDEKIADTLFDIAGDESEDIRLRSLIVDQFKVLDDEKSVMYLMEKFNVNENSAEMVLSVIQRIGKKITGILLDILKNEEEVGLRLNAAIALSVIKDVGSVPELLKILETENDELVAKAIGYILDACAYH